MKNALSQLYFYIICFLRLCDQRYSKNQVKRLLSALKSPFEIDYQNLDHQIKACSASIENLANAGARVEIRDIRTISGLNHSQAMYLLTNMNERQSRLESSVT
jgi:hypothetical protein